METNEIGRRLQRPLLHKITLMSKKIVRYSSRDYATTMTHTVINLF